MKRLLTAIALWTFYIPLAHAQDLGKGTLDTVAGQGGIKSSSTLPVIIGNLVKILVGALGLIFLILTVYAGFLYLTAAGDEEKVKHAKETLQRGVIGLIILSAAYALTVFVVNALSKSINPTGS